MEAIITYQNPIQKFLWESNAMYFFYALFIIFVLTAFLDNYLFELSKKYIFLKKNKNLISKFFFLLLVLVSFYIIFFKL